MTLAHVEIDETLNYEVHPAATLFPLIEGAAFDALVEDIRTRGQEVPVVLDRDGRLLDGRNRARACAVIGVDVKETRYAGDDPFAFVVSQNMHRRHLTESQRAMVAAKLANLRSGGQGGHVSPSIDGVSERVTTAEAARALNVSTASVERARLVRDHGSSEVQEAVEAGRMTVSKAATVIREAIRPSGRNYESAEKRAAQIRDLADQGATTAHIAKELQIGEEQVQRLARKHEITIRADVVRGKRRRIDHNRVLDNVTESLEVAVFGLRDIDADRLDREEALVRLDSLTTSINALSKAVKKIKESLHE